VSARSLGCLALALSRAALEAGVREQPMGSNDGPWLRIYRSGAVRHGRPLVAGPGPWCAYAASWAALTAWHHLGADAPSLPHGWRASVAELVEDARASGTWHPAGDGYIPQPGDLAVFRRGHGDPTRGGEGHVGRVERLEGDALTTIDGNHGDAWARVTRPVGEALGFIAYPQPAPET
jgi:hypothetical protein